MGQGATLRGARPQRGSSRPGDRHPLAVPWHTARGWCPTPAEGNGPHPLCPGTAAPLAQGMGALRQRMGGWHIGWGRCGVNCIWRASALAHRLQGTARGIARWRSVARQAQCTVHNTLTQLFLHLRRMCLPLLPATHSRVHTQHTDTRQQRSPVSSAAVRPHFVPLCHYTCSASSAAAALEPAVQHLLTCTHFAQLLYCNHLCTCAANHVAAVQSERRYLMVCRLQHQRLEKCAQARCQTGTPIHCVH